LYDPEELMPSDQNNVAPIQTDPRLTGKEEDNRSKYQKEPGESPEIYHEKLRNMLASLSGKLEELEEIDRRLLRVIDDETSGQADSTMSAEENLAGEHCLNRESARYRIKYQLHSLMEVLKPTLGFNNWGVFLLSGDGSGRPDADEAFMEIESSYQLETNESAKDFESEVESQYACGNVYRAISRKQRMLFKAERGKILIVPLSLANDKVGLWMLHFDKEMPASSDSGKELLLWGADMVATCLENIHRRDTGFSPQQQEESTSWQQREKLFSLSQLARAMVHEVNNSMQIILGRAQIARMNLNKSKEKTDQNHMWETIENNANRINVILKNFSDFLHRHSAGSPVPVNKGADKNRPVAGKEVNLHRILEGNLGLLQYILGSSGIELEMKNGDELPSVCGEPEEMELAFLGLFWAIRDNLTGGGNIRIRTYREGESLCFTVDWAGKKSGHEKPPFENESGDYTRYNQAMKTLEKYDHDLRFETKSDNEGKVVLRIPAWHNKTQVSRKEVKA
jgi:hypothetical protein